MFDAFKEVKDAPDPLKLVAVSNPEEELNARLEPLLGAKLPVAPVVNIGKQVVSDDSSATVIDEAVVPVGAANDNTPTITGQAEASSSIKLFNGSVEIGSGGATSSGSFSITVANPLADGTYTFTLTSTDSAGNISNTSTIAHTIDTSGSGGGGSSGGDGGGSSGGDGGGSGYGGGY